MSIPDKPIANPISILREEFDDHAVLFNPDTGDAIGLNPVGVAIWKLMDGKRSASDITAWISDNFSDVPATAEEDIISFVEDLDGRGFIGAEIC